jgi:hypothetical protein
MSDRNQKTRLQDAAGFVFIPAGRIRRRFDRAVPERAAAQRAGAGLHLAGRRAGRLARLAAALLLLAGLAALGRAALPALDASRPRDRWLGAWRFALGSRSCSASSAGGRARRVAAGSRAGLAGRALGAVLGLALAWDRLRARSARAPRRASPPSRAAPRLAARHDVAPGCRRPRRPARDRAARARPLAAGAAAIRASPPSAAGRDAPAARRRRSRSRARARRGALRGREPRPADHEKEGAKRRSRRSSTRSSARKAEVRDRRVQRRGRS